MIPTNNRKDEEEYLSLLRWTIAVCEIVIGGFVAFTMYFAVKALHILF